MSSISAPFSGSPLTNQRPFSQDRSSGRVSSIVAAICPRLVAHLARHDGDRAAAHRSSSATRTCRARTGGLVGVRRGAPRRSPGGIPSSSATICANVVSCPGPESARRSTRPALPDGCTAQVGAVVHRQAEDVHVLARAGADALGEERDADAHQLAACAARFFFRLPRGAGPRSRPSPSATFIRLPVVARVVRPPGGRLVRELAPA